MKAYRKEPEPEFVPVILEIETQEEVDKLFAIVRFNPICEALNLDRMYGELNRYNSSTDIYFNKLSNEIDRWYKEVNNID